MADLFAGGVRTAPATRHGYAVEGRDTNERKTQNAEHRTHICRVDVISSQTKSLRFRHWVTHCQEGRLFFSKLRSPGGNYPPENQIDRCSLFATMLVLGQNKVCSAVIAKKKQSQQCRLGNMVWRMRPVGGWKPLDRAMLFEVI